MEYILIREDSDGEKEALYCSDDWCTHVSLPEPPRFRMIKINLISGDDFDSLYIGRGHEIATYKVGLRVPDTLLSEQNALVMEREVIRYLLRNPNAKFAVFPKAKSSVADKYRKIFNKYAGRPKVYLERSLADNDLRLKKLLKNSGAFDFNSFTNKAVPKFVKHEKGVRKFISPTPMDISLRNYQYLAASSLKLIGAHINSIILDAIKHLPNLNKRSRREISRLTGHGGNIDETAYYILENVLIAFADLKDKVEDVSSLLSGDFYDVLPVLLSFYSVPNHFRKYLSKKWKVDAGWVRNTLVGWRRRLDPLLPKKFRIEELTGMFSDLAGYYSGFAEARNDDDIKVISVLQKRHVLHLLDESDVDLKPLLKKELRGPYINLKKRIRPLPPALKSALNSHVFNIPHSVFLNAAHRLINDVKANRAGFAKGSTAYKNCTTFINKIKYFIGVSSSAEFRAILSNYVVGNRFTRSISKLYQNKRYKRLFTALRGIIALALAELKPYAIVQFESVFMPRNCLTPPFTSKRRNRKYLPLNIISNKYVITVKASPEKDDFLYNKINKNNKESVTSFFARGEPVWIGIPIYTPDLFDPIKCLLNKNARVKSRFWFKLIPSKKIINCIKRGAQVHMIRLNVPRGPARKIVADITLAAPRKKNAFRHGLKFISSWDNAGFASSIPENDIMGVDFNRIGKYMIAVANPDAELDLGRMMDFYQKKYRLLEHLRHHEIPGIQRKISGLHNSPRRKRLESQLTLLFRRMQNITREMKLQSLMVYLFAAFRAKAKYLSWDSIGGISTRGKKGTLAQAVTYLPKRKVLYDIFRKWASDLHEAGLLPSYRDTIPVRPFTSSICGECMKPGLRQGATYDDIICPHCGHVGNRHSNAARVAAKLLQDHLHKSNINFIDLSSFRFR